VTLDGDASFPAVGVLVPSGKPRKSGSRMRFTVTYN
jgi:hypothetical protein